MLTPSSLAPTLRVAIYRTSSIGDVVLATACLDLLSRLTVPTKITWIGRGPSLKLIAAAWPEVHTIEMNRTDMGDVQRAATELSKVHVFVDLQCNLRSRWLTRALRRDYDIPSFSADKMQIKRNRLLVEARVRGRRKPLPEASRTPDVLQYELMLDALRKALKHHLPVEMRDGIDAPTIRPRLPLPSQPPDRPWHKELRFGAWLAVAPGAAHPTKQAPPEIFLDILEQVREGAGSPTGMPPVPLGLLFLGDERDRAVALDLLGRLHWRDPVLNLAGKLSLWETTLALSETTCLLSNDSSLGHIAEAVDTPTAVMFGPTIESFGFAPRKRQSRAFSVRVGCRPCSKHGKVPCRYDDKLCFTAMPTGDVATHLGGIFSSPESRYRRRLVEGRANGSSARSLKSPELQP